MDRGDTGFIIHESFKDLKTRRAEQEAYRKALEEQIKQKRRLQEKEREKNEVRRTCNEALSLSLHTPRRTQELPAHHSPRILPPETMEIRSSPIAPFTGQPPMTPSHDTSRPTSRGYRASLNPAPSTLSRVLSFNEIDNYNEPHPAAVVTTTNVKEKTTRGITPNTDIPEFSPECMKYLQHVLPGFTLPPLPTTPSEFAHPKNTENQNSTASGKTGNGTTTSVSNGFCSNAHYDHNNNQAFSSGTTSESSSVEDVQTQTSDQLEGVKVSRKQYREELQKQIDERKRREEEARRKAEEEEERIQEKIRLDQEKMQREYEEELRKQEEREKEAEKKRIATLAKQKEVLRTQEESKTTRKMHSTKENSNVRDVDVNVSITKSSRQVEAVAANPSTSEESIQSIGEFFDETMIPQGTKYVDPDDRIIPVVAKRLREKSMNIEKEPREKEQSFCNEKLSLTARIDSAFSDPSMIAPQTDIPPPPQQGLIREIAIRSAPCPTTANSTDMEFLSTLKSYLQCEKDKIDERILAKNSKSTERF